MQNDRLALTLGYSVVAVFALSGALDAKAQDERDATWRHVSVELPSVRLHVDDLRAIWSDLSLAAFGTLPSEWGTNVGGECHLFTTTHQAATGKSLESALALIPRGAVIDRAMCSAGKRVTWQERPPVRSLSLSLHLSQNSLQLSGYDTVRMAKLASQFEDRLAKHGIRVQLSTQRSLHSAGMAAGLLLAPVALLLRRRRMWWVLLLSSAALVGYTYLNPPPKSLPATLIETSKR